jgi:hypothetical protein
MDIPESSSLSHICLFSYSSAAVLKKIDWVGV